MVGVQERPSRKVQAQCALAPVPANIMEYVHLMLPIADRGHFALHCPEATAVALVAQT